MLPVSDEELKVLLVKNKFLDDNGWNNLVEFAKNSNILVSDATIEKDIIADSDLGKLVADYLKIPFISLTKMSIAEDVFHIIPERVARKQKAIPFARDKDGIKIAMLNPLNKDFLALVSKKTGDKVIPYLATERDLYNTFYIYRQDLQRTIEKMIQDGSIPTEENPVSDAPIAKIVDLLISYAYEDKASDIHIEPQEKNSLVRFRLDGILHDVLYLPKNLHDRVITRIKVLSKLRTDEHLSPQDGKMRMKFEDEFLDIRVSIIPIAEGEKVVLRLLASHFRQFSLQDLGMNEVDLKKIEKAISKSYGMILSTGPTGSGKTTTIYAILKILNIREKNITTIEDPIEYRIKGVNQIQVNPKTNLTFASGLRSILRQDPNIIFVGEIRDDETAGIAVNAALTGHLVLSTLHTNDAATALPRLTDMKVEPFLVASTINVIIAQRLVRKICESCRESYTIKQSDLDKNLPPDVVKKFFGSRENITIYRGKGCKICHFTGYSGRIGIFEVLELSKNIKKKIVELADSDVIERLAIEEGMTSMLGDGVYKVLNGMTSIEEVLRVTKVENL